MTRLHKFSLKKNCFYLIVSIFCIAITVTADAGHIYIPRFVSTLTSDTIPGPSKKTVARDTIPSRSDTTRPVTRRDTLSTVPRIDTLNFKFSKDTLDAPVNYSAGDSGVLFVKEQKFLLYGGTKTTYKDVELNSPEVQLDQKTNLLTAKASRDAAGNIITRAEFKQGQQQFQSDSLVYNFKTQKALTQNTYTHEGELFIKAGTAKKVNANTMFIKEGYYTTCNLDDPHFAFKSDRLKIINNKIAVSGPTHPEFEGVPIPLYLPFGIYPLSQGRHSGLLPPQFTVNERYGLGLEGLGYYHVLNDYLDVTVRTNVYSFGGWSANLTPSYRKRYKYNGAFNISLQHFKTAFKGDPDYSLNKTFQINWNHSVDQRARPGTTFSASVNAGSSKHNELIANNPLRNIQNQLYSSITYTKQWQDKPYSLQLSANHNQNNTTRLFYVTLPDAGFTVTTLYPFEKKEILGTQKWYEKIGVGYQGVARNQVAFYDTAFSFKRIIDTLQWGARHSFPISLQLPPVAGNLFLSPSISYEETWITQRLKRKWNDQKNKVDTISTDKGLYVDRHMSFGVGFNTNIFGTFRFKKKTGITALRHVIRPTFGMSYSPNMSKKFYDVIQVDTAHRMVALPQLQSSMFQPYGYGKFGGISFGVDNNLEMKVRGKKDTVEKKVRLIDGFGFNSGYNFLSDSLKLQPFNVYLRSTLFEKINLTAQALLDPYQAGPTGSINRFVWEGDHFAIATLRNASISMSTSFQSKPRDPDKASDADKARKITEPSLLADQQSLVEYMHRNPAEFVDFNIPWSVNMSFALTLSKYPKPDYSGFTSQVSSTFQFSNSFSLTPKWNFSTNGYFDFDTRKLTVFTMSISRDMHCWQMSINVTPVGEPRFFNITINPKASILQDLKINRTRTFYNY